MKFLSPLLSALLSYLLATTPLMARAPALDSSSEAVPASLQIRITESDGPTAVAGSRSAKGFTVEVKDASGTPVENAAVVFRLPDSAPSGTFVDGGGTAVAYTDTHGRAKIGVIQWGAVPGVVGIRVTAAKDMLHSGILLEENLTAGAPAPAGGVSPQTPRPAAPTPMPLPTTSVSVPVAVKISSLAAPSVVVTNFSPRRQPAQPGTVATQSDLPVSAVVNDDSPDANVPIRHFASTGAGVAEAPEVSVVSSGAASGGGHSKTKWLIAIAVVAGAGAAVAMLHKGGSSSSASGTSIGSPTISVGHP